MQILAATDRDAGTVLAVDDGRIAVWGGYKRLVLLNERGERLSTFRLASLDPGSVRLTGSDLVMLRGGAIEVRNDASGKLLHRWPTPPSDAPVRLIGAQGNLAVYMAGIAIHVLRLTDGRDRMLWIPGEQGPVVAGLQPEGLYYSYMAADASPAGRVAFTPFRELSAGLR